jgi:hypothetical protein
MTKNRCVFPCVFIDTRMCMYPYKGIHMDIHTDREEIAL